MHRKSGRMQSGAISLGMQTSGACIKPKEKKKAVIHPPMHDLHEAQRGVNSMLIDAHIK